MMWRMVWKGGSHPTIDRVTRLGAGDVPALEQLYADGESPANRRTFSIRRW